MKSNLYLYNTNDVPEIPNEVIVRRLELLQDNLNELLEVAPEKRDRVRIHYINKAVSFWQSINHIEEEYK